MKLTVENFAPAVRSPLQKLLRESRREPSGTIFIHPDYTNVSRAQLGNGCLVFGSPGSGKTSIILPYVVRLIEADEKLLALDVKNEQVQKLGNVHFLAPWLRGSLILDIGKDVTTASDAKALADVLIRVPDSGKDKIWAAAANAVCYALILDLVKTRPQAWDWQDLASQLDKSLEEWAALMREHAPATAKILEGAAETSASVAFNVITELRNLRTVADMFAEAERFGGRRFSLRKWIADKNYDIRQIVLCSSDEFGAVVGFIVPFIVNYIATKIGRMPDGGGDPKNIILDEFAQLPLIAFIAKLYEIGRSKGLNTLLAVQDWEQVIQTYGEHFANIIFSNASIKVIARTSASHGQECLAKRMGGRDVAILSQSNSSGNGATAPSVSQTYQRLTLDHVLAGELESELGPHSFIPNPDSPKGDKIPTKIRAILRPMSGNMFYLDWPLIRLPEVRKTPELLPSHHPDVELIREILRDGSLPLGDRALAAYKRTGMSARELAALMFSDGMLSAKQWEDANKGAKSAAGVLNSLPHSGRAQRNEEATSPPGRAHEMAAASMRDQAPEEGKRFEGLAPDPQQPAIESAESDALADVAGLAVVESLGGNALAVELGKVALEVIDALSEKQAPEPVQTQIGDGPSDPQASKRAALRARLAAGKANRAMRE
jgi:hypothetical protein